MKQHTEEPITQILERWRREDEGALDDLIPLVYSELKAIARGKLKGRQHSLFSSTDLVNEACMKLLKCRPDSHQFWHSRVQFYGFVSTLMRHILLDHARSRAALKNGGDRAKITLDPDRIEGKDVDILHLDLTLERLQRMNSRQAQIWQCRYLCGLSIEEIAELFQLGLSSIHNDLRAAKAWVRMNLGRA